MADIKISNKLITNNPGKIIADASNIAYSTKIEGSGSLSYEAIDKSIKDKIDEIEASVENSDISTLKNDIEDIKTLLSAINLTADKVIYSSTTSGGVTTTISVKEKLDSIQKTVDSLNTSTIASLVAAAELAANEAKTIGYGYYADSTGYPVAIYNTTLKKYIGSSGNSVTESDGKYYLDNVEVTFVKGILEIRSEYMTKIDNALDLADTLESNFDVDANFAVITNSAYKSKLEAGTLSDNTIYFCIDGTASVEDLLYDVSLSCNGNATVKMANGSKSKTITGNDVMLLTSLTYNSALLLTITPNSGYAVKNVYVNASAKGEDCRSVTIIKDTLIEVKIVSRSYSVKNISSPSVSSTSTSATITFDGVVTEDGVSTTNSYSKDVTFEASANDATGTFTWNGVSVNWTVTKT